MRNRIIILVLAWLIQDFAQVLLMGVCIVPDLFVLTALLFAALEETDSDNVIWLIWVVFAGALLWDLRWTNIPGLSAALGGFLIGSGYCMWKKIPAQGRSLFSFFGFSLLCEIIYGGVHFLFWTTPSMSSVRQFLMQEILSVPIIILLSWIYGVRTKDV